MANAVSTRTIEVVMFRAKPETSDIQILDLSDELQREVEAFQGCIHRRLLKDGDGNWIDLVDWNSLEEAMAASEAISSTPLAAEFGALVEPGSVKVLHLSPVRVYQGAME